MKKAPLLITVLFVLAAVICLISASTLLAGLTDAQKLELQRCAQTYNQCVKGCTPESSSQCKQACLNQYYECRQKARIPDYAHGGPPEVTGQNSPPNKSNPTPTPRKGPGKIGTTGIGHSSPTPSPSGPVFLEKSGKPAPTPRPTPKKGDHH
jgi:hypothetical protein